MLYPSYPSPSLQPSLGYSRINDHNRYPQTDILYDPLRKVLLNPNQIAMNRQYLNPAANQSRITNQFSYLTENQLRAMRQHILIPVDQPLIPTHNLQKVRNSRFMVVDAKQYQTGGPITAEQMQRIRSHGLREQKIVYDFGARRIMTTQPVALQTRTITPITTQAVTTTVANTVVTPPPPPPPVVVQAPPPPTETIIHQVQPIIRQTKIIKQEPKTSYSPPTLYQDQYKVKDKYKYNLYSMMDEQVNGGGCTCPSNQVIASRNQPQSINWLN